MATSASPKPRYRDGNSTADRALTVLQMFTPVRARVSATEVAEHLDVSRSTAYRYLQTLVGASFLTEDAAGGFRLGSKVIELAGIARRAYGLSEVARPVMADLANEFHETVLLTKRIGSAIVCLEREEWTGRQIRISYERGSQLSFNAGASALILLAWLPEADQRTMLQEQPLPVYTERTLTEPDEIVNRLTQIRADGYAVGRGEVDPNTLGISAPIFRGQDVVEAGLSFVMLQSRAEDNVVREMVEALRSATRHLSDELTLYSS